MIFDHKAKCLAILIALLNLYLGFLASHIEGMLFMLIWDIFVLSFIWMSEFWGGMRADLTIQRETSPEIMALLGWILLFGPMVIVLSGFLCVKLKDSIHY